MIHTYRGLLFIVYNLFSFIEYNIMLTKQQIL